MSKRNSPAGGSRHPLRSWRDPPAGNNSSYDCIKIFFYFKLVPFNCEKLTLFNLLFTKPHIHSQLPRFLSLMADN
jgi:hypothetical protein